MIAVGDLRLQRPGVADAGGAAVADEVEADGVEIFLQPGGFQVFGHHLRARGERGLDPGLAVEAERARLAGHETGADHDIGFEVLVHEVIEAITTLPEDIA